VSTERLAQEACEVEIDIIGKPIGKQDHYAASFGGLNEIIFYKNGDVNVSRINLTNDKLRALSSYLLMFYTDITRRADSILKKQQQKSEAVFDTLIQMRDQVLVLRENLENGLNGLLGKILNRGWELKKSLLSEISNRQIDEMYEWALESGATGGKICGAGGGGFLLLYVPVAKQEAVKKALRNHREFPFMLERYGSRIIFNHKADYWR
jgi:D-glycero-alpha-D-manno-heptose-7-phosphate kinase